MEPISPLPMLKAAVSKLASAVSSWKLDDLAKTVKEGFENLSAGLGEISTPELLEQAFHFAVSYVERKEQSVSLELLISMIKGTFFAKKGTRYVVLKRAGDAGIVQLDCVAFGEGELKDAQLLFGAKTPWLHIETLELAPDLAEQFDDKDMIVLQ